MKHIYALLTYLRLASYSIVLISSIFSLTNGIKSVKRVFWGNIIFAILASLSAFHYAVLGKDLELMVSVFITTGATIWSIMCFTNFIRYDSK